MSLMTIQEAAQYLGTSEDQVMDWVNRGMLRKHILVQPGVSGHASHSSLGVLSLLRLVDGIDQEELDEVAETEGWLSIAASSADEEND